MEEIPDIPKGEPSDTELSGLDPQSRMIPLSEVIAGYNNSTSFRKIDPSRPRSKFTNRKAVLWGVLFGIIVSIIALLVFMTTRG